MSDSESTSEQNGLFGEESAVVSRNRTPRNWKLLVGIAAVGILVIVAGGVTVFLLQPTAIERAGETCSGAKPLDAFLDELTTSESPKPIPAETQDAETQRLYDELFDGVVTVEDDGTTLIVSTKPTDDDALGVTSLALDCVYEALEVPKYVTELVGATRALDGRQSGEWANYSASWGYHPDSGMNLIIATK